MNNEVRITPLLFVGMASPVSLSMRLPKLVQVFFLNRVRTRQTINGVIYHEITIEDGNFTHDVMCSIPIFIPGFNWDFLIPIEYPIPST
jgi:hypothetical protein